MMHSQPTTETGRPTGSLENQITALENLRTCLEEEHRALQSRDPEMLLAVTERKTACLSEANRIARQQRETGSAQTSVVVDRDTNRRREHLDTLTRTCRELNDANGALIRRQRVRVETTLRILRGDPAQSDLYSPTGQQSQNGPARRTLASI